ncbi:MAG: MmcQ/YjbR family DNA-binding protein [Clostridiaceae bacterium]|jgi:predicted DNA-binding protein (MmcQ/YjbR family)|nr:MmcQ/YjbR family DNA-binding protein [Clostridiaceae bacterium]
MKYAWMDEYCLSKKGAQKDFKEEWQATRYMIGGKMFVMQGGDKYGTPIATVKLEPTFGRFLREQYKDIVPGYYMNKEHWNSLYLEGDVPDDVFRDMLDQSYAIVLSSLPKSVQKELEA